MTPLLVATRDGTALPEAPNSDAFLTIRRSPHSPWVNNGEAEVAAMLRRNGIRHEYETRFYQFGYTPPGSFSWRDGGFCPDFYLPATRRRPPMNLEVTFADRGLPTMSRHERQSNLYRLRLKRLKIQLTAELFDVETILVTQRVFMQLRQDPAGLPRLVRNAAARHHSRARQALPLARTG